MMYNPFISTWEAQERYQEMLRDAENRRRYRASRSQHPTWFARVLTNMQHRLADMLHGLRPPPHAPVAH